MSNVSRIESLVRELYPLNRSLVSEGTDKALDILGSRLPGLKIHRFASGTRCWTWTVPKEWVLRDAWVKDSWGRTIVSLRDSHLMVGSYSKAVDAVLTKSQLAAFVATDQQRPSAFPFVFKHYYRDGWGVSIPYNIWSELREGDYHVFIDSEFRDGELKVGEYRLEGKTSEMITLISDICHPDQVNDSITGVAAALEVIERLRPLERRYTYQFLFLPETIGSIAYLSQNTDVIPSIRFACFSEMLGTPGEIVLQRTRQGDTLIDKAALMVLGRNVPQHRFREGVSSDEMVFNGPGINIPTISLTRCFDPQSPYPEYHSSLDTPEILDYTLVESAADKISSLFMTLDKNYIPTINFRGPVFLTAYDMFVSQAENPGLNLLQEKIMLSLEDGESVLEIADRLEMEFDELLAYLEKYRQHGLITTRSA